MCLWCNEGWNLCNNISTTYLLHIYTIYLQCPLCSSGRGCGWAGGAAAPPRQGAQVPGDVSPVPGAAARARGACALQPHEGGARPRPRRWLRPAPLLRRGGRPRHAGPRPPAPVWGQVRGRGGDGDPPGLVAAEAGQPRQLPAHPGREHAQNILLSIQCSDIFCHQTKLIGRIVSTKSLLFCDKINVCI